MKISIIAAIGRNRELGKDNKLLWHIPEDMKRFRDLTSGHAIIMGRKTFESIGRPLPNRTNIVITRVSSLTRCHLARQSGDLIVCRSLEEALTKAAKIEKNEIFIIGGGQIYAVAMPFADRLYLTIVDSNFEADTFFPDYSEFKKVLFEQKGESGNYKYTFLELEK